MALWAAEPARTAYDVAIVGGGAMGVSAALHLAREPGFSGRVAVFERDPGLERAGTTLTNSCIRQQFSSAVNIRMSLAGVAFIRGFRAAIGREDAPEIRLEGFGYLYLAATAAGEAALRAAQAVQAAEGVATRLHGPEAIAAGFPWLAGADLRLAAHNPGDEGHFDSATMVDWMRRAARDLGVEFVAGEVAGLVREGARVTGLRLASGRAVAAGSVVNAAGTRAARIAAMAGRELPVEPRRRYSVVFEAERPCAGPLPLTILPEGVHVRSDGANFLCGWPPAEDMPAAPDDFAWTDPFEETAWPALAARIPAFERLRVINGWVGHYAWNRLDRNAILGPDPEIAGILWMNGCSGHGMQHCPAMGRAIAELVVHGGYRSLDLSELSVARILENRPLAERAVI